MYKRGISAVVATVLIILITVAAVTVIWMAIIPMISENMAFNSITDRVDVVTSEGYTFYDSSEGYLSVQVKRSSEESEMIRMEIITSVEGNSFTTTVDAPEPGQSRVYIIDMDGRGEPSSVSVAPIYKVENKEKAGDAGNPVDVGDGKVDQVLFVYEEGSEYNYTLPIDGIVAYWRMDDGSLEDSVGSYDMIAEGSGVSFSDGVANFDGSTDSYMRYNAGDELSPGMNSFTYSAWIYPTRLVSNDRDESYNPGYARFFSISNYCNPWQDHCNYIIGQYREDGRVQFSGRVYGESSSFGVTSSSSDPISVDEWVHIAYVIDRDPDYDYEYLYINGEFSAGNTFGKSGSLNMTKQRFQSPANWCELTGKMDDIMIYHSALSAEEVKALYDVQKK
jgi:hypothetical protein